MRALNQRAMLKLLIFLILLTIQNATGADLSAREYCDKELKNYFKLKHKPPLNLRQRLVRFAELESGRIAKSMEEFDCSEKYSTEIKSEKILVVCAKKGNAVQHNKTFCNYFLRTHIPNRIKPRRFKNYGCAVHFNSGKAVVAAVCAFKDRRK